MSCQWFGACGRVAAAFVLSPRGCFPLCPLLLLQGPLSHDLGTTLNAGCRHLRPLTTFTYKDLISSNYVLGLHADMSSGGSRSPTLQRWTLLQHSFTLGWTQSPGLGLRVQRLPWGELAVLAGQKALGRDPKCMCRGHLPTQRVTPSRRLEPLGYLLGHVDRADLE